MAKARLESNGYVSIKCPGCKYWHMLPVDPAQRPSWKFNGDMEKPTFMPSILQRSGHFIPGQTQPPDCPMCNSEHKDFYNCSVCHSFVKDGMIQFLTDSTHDLAGKTVPLPDIT